jgi:dienelactone hydrolase
MPRLLALLLLTAASAAGTAASAAAGGAGPFVFSNEPGPYPVGVQVTAQYDYSRVYRPVVDLVTGEPETHERARPIQSITWYPAKNKGKPLTWRDYMATNATEYAPWLSPAEAQRATEASIKNNLARLASASGSRVLAQPMWAARGAAAADGKFPVVIYAPSFNATATENVDLCEYLASHGYIVIASRSLGAHSKSMTTDLEGLETQAGDIAFLVGQAHAIPQADMSRIAVVGYSWGGLANVLAAAKDDRIRALVSLDGSVRLWTQFVDGGKDAAKYATPGRVAVPTLFVGREHESFEEIVKNKRKTDYSLLNEMTYADMTIVTMRPMRHEHFASDNLRFSPDGEFSEYSRDEVSLAHSWAMRYVERFLDAYLKKDAKAMAFLDNKPAANKAPRTCWRSSGARAAAFRRQSKATSAPCKPAATSMRRQSTTGCMRPARASSSNPAF